MSRFPQLPISVLSIGTRSTRVVSSRRTRNFSNADMGIVQLMTLGIPLKIIRQGGFVTNELSKSILGDRFLRVEGVINRQIDDIARAESEGACEGDRMWDRSIAEIQTFITRVKTPDLTDKRDPCSDMNDGVHTGSVLVGMSENPDRRIGGNIDHGTNEQSDHGLSENSDHGISEKSDPGISE